MAGLDFGLLQSLGESIKNAGGAVEDGIGAAGGIIRKCLEEATKTGVTVEDAASELAEHAIKAVSDNGGNVEEAAGKILNQTLELAGELGENGTAAAEKAGSGIVKAAGGLGTTTLGQAKAVVAAAVPGRDTSEDPD